MAYLTKADLTTVYSSDLLEQLTDGDDDRLTAAFIMVDNEIDRRLRNRYIVPFEVLPSELQDIAIAIAWYALYAGQGDTPEDVKERYNNAINTLKDISKGTISLDGDIERATTNGAISASYRVLSFDDDKYTL